jgi:hypothetical protein
MRVNVVGVYIVQASLLLIGQQSLGDFFRYRPLLPIDRRFCKFYANAVGNEPVQRQLPLVQCKQQANPLLLTHNYTPLVISRNDKNKQLTIIKLT